MRMYFNLICFLIDDRLSLILKIYSKELSQCYLNNSWQLILIRVVIIIKVTTTITVIAIHVITANLQFTIIRRIYLTKSI